MRSTAPCTNRSWRGFGQMGKTAKPKSRHLPKSTAGDFATTATDSAQSLIKSHLAENPCDGAFSKSAVFRIGLLPSDAGRKWPSGLRIKTALRAPACRSPIDHTRAGQGFARFHLPEKQGFPYAPKNRLHEAANLGLRQDHLTLPLSCGPPGRKR